MTTETREDWQSRAASLDLRSGAYIGGSVVEAVSGVTFENYSPATVSAYGCAFRQFLDWRIEGKYGDDFTPEQARQ